MAAGHGVDRTRRGSTAREPSNRRAGREASKTARAKARRERHNERHLQPQAGRAAAALALSRADLRWEPAVMLQRFGQCGHSATPSVLPPQRCRQPSVSTHSNSWLLSRLHASTGRRGRASAPQRMQARPSSWASVRVAGNLPDGCGRLSGALRRHASLLRASGPGSVYRSGRVSR